MWKTILRFLAKIFGWGAPEAKVEGAVAGFQKVESEQQAQAVAATEAREAKIDARVEAQKAEVDRAPAADLGSELDRVCGLAEAANRDRRPD